MGKVTDAAVEVCMSLDGTAGRSWSEVADRLDARARGGMPAEVNAESLARLVRLVMVDANQA